MTSVWEISGAVLTRLICKDPASMQHYAERLGVSDTAIRNWMAGAPISPKHFFRIQHEFGDAYTEPVYGALGYRLVPLAENVRSLDEARRYRDELRAMADSFDANLRAALG